MQVTETLSEGLKREFKVVVPAAELDAKVNVRLDEIKGTVRINGFRPGKVPVAHLKRVYGRSAMAEVIEATVRDANNQIVCERGFKLAADPKVTLPTEQGAVEHLIEGKSDLAYTMAVEILPPIELANFKDIKLDPAVERHRPTPKSMRRSSALPSRTNPTRRRPREAGGAGRPRHYFLCRQHRRRAFEGGTGDDTPVMIGSNTFIPGLRGSARRDRRRRNPHAQGDFPEHYQAESRRQGCRVRGHRQGDRDARQHHRRR